MAVAAMVPMFQQQHKLNCGKVKIKWTHFMEQEIINSIWVDLLEIVHQIGALE